jgi:hypothetical protein
MAAPCKLTSRRATLYHGLATSSPPRRRSLGQLLRKLDQRDSGEQEAKDSFEYCAASAVYRGKGEVNIYEC